jgi:ribosome-associated protein
MDKQLIEIIKAADSKRAENISVLDIRQQTIIADYFVIMSAETKRQVKAIADEIQDKMKENGFTINRVEGLTEARWIVLDLGDYVVHIFDDESYEFYQLYRVWDQAEQVDVSEYITEN